MLTFGGLQMFVWKHFCGRTVPSFPWVFSGHQQLLECLDTSCSYGSDSLRGLCYLLQSLPNH